MSSSEPASRAAVSMVVVVAGFGGAGFGARFLGGEQPPRAADAGSIGLHEQAITANFFEVGSFQSKCVLSSLNYEIEIARMMRWGA